MKRTAPICLLIIALSLALTSAAFPQLARQANTTLAMPADLPSSTGYDTENALGTLSFSEPLCVATPAGETDRLFVVERSGTIQIVENLNTTPTKRTTPFLTLTSVPGVINFISDTDGECGLLSMAIHPNFASNGYFFVFYSFGAPSGRYFQRVARMRRSDANPNIADPASFTPLLTVYDLAENHNGGDMAFGPDGYLYISMGDGGAANDYYDNARFINKSFFGSILRIDVDRKPENLEPNPHTQSSSGGYPSAVHPGTYKVPADNPFIGYTSWHNQIIDPNTVRTEIWATGLRNPWRFSFDAPTGRLFCGDVGQGDREEIDLIVKGGDYGWSWLEGTLAFHEEPEPTTPPLVGFNPIPAIHEYGRDVGGTVIGGEVMRGDRLPELYGAYIFSEHSWGDLYALLENAGTWTRTFLCHDANIAELGVDPRNGDVLLVDRDGPVKRLKRTGTTGTPPPATLSATGAFSNLATLTPNTGIVPYDPNVAFWSDNAIKSRWFCIKSLSPTITFGADGNWTFPTGTVWIKHFDIETTPGVPATKRKLETRFLVKTATDVYGLSYKWRADQSNADLVAEEGLTEVIPSSSPAQTWRYPSRTECKICHTPVGGFALSFNTRQVNRNFTYGSVTQNQIAALSGAGYFSAPVTGVNNLPAFARANDTTQSLEWRVRSYLATNCVQCHQPGGAALGNWDARPTTPTDLANLINGQLVDNGGNEANRWCVPGDTTLHSMVLKRVSGIGAPRMPPLATFIRNTEAENLLANWINELLTRQNFTQWQAANFGSSSVPQAAPEADPDSDGQNNQLEFLARTDPNNSSQRLTLTPHASGSNFELTFTQPANRSLLIETSTDLGTWSLWDVSGNAPSFGATSQTRTLFGPFNTDSKRFFRARLLSP
jgi:glucose/arabinose dehydrogenase